MTQWALQTVHRLQRLHFGEAALRFSIKEAVCLKDCFNPCIC